ncbi:hypothetical protein ABL78_1853 [Leptomonas seymouri]|uniref:Uncharacterized protein n=1 Tax=Leptomonas seymouri TaxID=5684 RepID=A0A0N1ILY4_LEPSE|nr:hypothetical protein ABL78_1853 [Leptomonas seymouri]|eukprot:KPI89040.1 hypothetical protein ABL78_1853 [Leptomonas seymouri]
MPSCPECGLVFDSLHNVQLHRRSGACAKAVSGARAAPAWGVSHAAATRSSSGGNDYERPVRGPMLRPGGAEGHLSRGYMLAAAPPLVTATNVYLTPAEHEVEQTLAYQRSRQAKEVMERERLMLDQQLDLVLQAQQDELQQAPKSQLSQMKLQLLGDQKAQEQSSMNMAYLRNEIAAMRGAIESLSTPQTVGTDKRRKKHTHPRRASSACNTANRRSPTEQDSPQRPRPDSYGGERRSAYTPQRHHTEYGRDNLSTDDDESWSSVDEEMRSDDSGDHVSSRNRRAGHREKKSGSPLSEKICKMLQGVQHQLKSLQTASAPLRQCVDAPFPTVSTLAPGLHLMKFASIEGIDISVPLDEIDVVVKVYYMSYAGNEYLLEPSIEQTFPRHQPPLVRHGSKTLLFTVPPIEFVVHHPKEMVVFVLQAFYRGRLLCWATVFATHCGAIREGLRDSDFDLATALQSPQATMPEASVSVFIEADVNDSLRCAETLLNESNPSAIATGTSSVSPLPHPVPSQLPGLPSLPSPPQGLPLLPGMPGCEGPFLPPVAEVDAMVLQPNNRPVTRFILPPPMGVSILEWQESLAKHLKEIQGRASPPAVGNRAATPPQSSTREEESKEQSGEAKEEDEDAVEAEASNGSNLNGTVTVVDNGKAKAAAATVEPATTELQSVLQASTYQKSASPQPMVKSNSLLQSAVMKRPPTPPKHFTAASCADSQRSLSSQRHTPPLNRSNNPFSKALSSPRSSVPAADRPAVASSLVSSGAAKPYASPTNSSTPENTPALLETPPTNGAPPLPVSGPPPLGKVPYDDMSLVERQRLRPVTDPEGNLAVPRGYKMNRNNPPSVNLAAFDASAEPPVNPCVLLGLALPTSKPPTFPKAPGHGTSGATVDVFLDGVTGLPLDAVCTRLLVFLTDTLDPTTGKTMNPLHDPRVFMRKPDFIVIQDLASRSIEPQFGGQFSTEVSDSTYAVVIIEFLGSVPSSTFVFGHCCLPINKKFFAGNYLCRVRLGDPRRSQERAVADIRPAERIADEQRRATEKYNQMQLELSIDSQALRNILPAPPRKRSECVILGYLIWRIDSSKKDPFFEMPLQLPLSQAELMVFEGRKKHNGTTTPNSKGLTTLEAADSAFPDAIVTPSDALGSVVPFSGERGAFIKIEGIRGVGNDAAMYVVVVYMPKAPPDRQVCYTIMPDWLSDVGAPMFKDAPFIFTGIKHDVTNTVTYMLLKLTNLKVAAEGGVKVEVLGWTMNKLFLDTPGTMRQGRFALPWITGSLQPDVVSDLLTQRIESVHAHLTKRNRLNFLSPPATLLLSQGDSACVSYLVDETPGRGSPRLLLVPAALKKAYPTTTCEGMVGCTLRRAHEQCFGGGDPRATLQRVNVAVQEYLRVTMRTFGKA